MPTQTLCYRTLPLLLAMSSVAVHMSGCGGGDNSTTTIIAPPVSSTATAKTSDPAATPTTQAVMRYLADLSNDTLPGVLAGQNSGHGDQILNNSGPVGYAALIAALEQQTGEAPALLGLDYEYDAIFTPEQLANANQKLIEHWQAGGLITINWSPNNPWWNDESDLSNHPGGGDLTRTYGGDMNQVKLTDLVTTGTQIQPIWQRKLDRIATALQELQAAGVVVLWRPMQEMNGSWFWWGISSEPQSCSGYIQVWQQMYRYFTQEKGLHNLLWVYSPNRGPMTTDESYGIKPVGWCYPGSDYVDVVAGTRYDDTLSIDDYQSYRQFGKPLGMGEYGPTIAGKAATAGSFDTRSYAQVLANYPAIAYWVSWHDWNNADGSREHQSLVGNQHTLELMQNGAIVTRSRVDPSSHSH